MPTPPYAKILASIAGGGNTSGGLTAAFGQTVQLSAESTVGWSAAIWEIVDYPPGFSTPGSWTLDATTKIIYFQPGTPTTAPPLITLPASGANNWGKFAFRLRINGNPLQLNPDGTPNSSFVTSLQDTATWVDVLSPTLALHGIAFSETTQYDAQRAWVGELMRDLRLLESTGASVTWAGDLAGSSSSSQIVVSLTGSGGTLAMASTAAVMQWALGATSPALKQANQTANSTNGQTLTIQAQNATGTTSIGGGAVITSGTGTTRAGNLDLQTGGVSRLLIDNANSVATFGSGYSVAIGTTPSGTGLVRLPNNQAIKTKSSGGGDSQLLIHTSGDFAQVGDATNFNGCIINAASAGQFFLARANSTDWLLIDNTGVHCGQPLAGYSGGSKASALKASSGGTLVIAASAVTLSAAQYQCFYLKLTGTPGADRTVIGPGNTTDEMHIVWNNTNNAQTFKAAATTGVSLTAGKAYWVWWNGADYEAAGASTGF